MIKLTADQFEEYVPRLPASLIAQVGPLHDVVAIYLSYESKGNHDHDELWNELTKRFD